MAALAQKEAFLRLLWMRHKRHPKRKHKYQWGSGTCMLGNTCSQAYWHEASWMTKRPKIRTKKRGFHCRSCWQRGAEWEAEESWQGWQRAPEIRGGWQAAAAPRVHASWRWSLGNKETRALSSLLLTAAEVSLFADVGWSITAGLPGRSLCRGQDPYLQPAQSISATHPAALFVQPWCRQTETRGSLQLGQDHLPLPAGSWKVKADEICKANSTRTARDWKRHEGSLTLLGAVLPSPLPTAIIPADLQIPDSYFWNEGAFRSGCHWLSFQSRVTWSDGFLL